MKLEPKFKLWLEVDGKAVIGEGRASLLEEIDKCGSLSKAADILGISYRHAYDLIGNLNDRFGKDIVETSVGGEKGGGTRLTPTGKRLLTEFLSLKNEMEEAIGSHEGGFRV